MQRFSRKKLIFKADKLWSEIIKLKARRKCEHCGNKEHLNSHHIFSRSNWATRWDLDNGCLLCPLHHVLGTFSAHKAPLEFGEWLKEVRGQEWYDALRRKAKIIIKQDYEEVIKGLEKQKSYCQSEK